MEMVNIFGHYIYIGVFFDIVFIGGLAAIMLGMQSVSMIRKLIEYIRGRKHRISLTKKRVEKLMIPAEPGKELDALRRLEIVEEFPLWPEARLLGMTNQEYLEWYTRNADNRAEKYIAQALIRAKKVDDYQFRVNYNANGSIRSLQVKLVRK